MNVSKENCAEVIDDLRTFLTEDMVAPRDREFAKDLISGKFGFDTRGYLSQKQMDWVGKISDRAIGVEPEQETTSVGNLEAFVKLFTDAKANLKFPKIIMESCDMPLKFTVAGDKAKFPGTINITDGGPWGENVWYGRVDAEGTWAPSTVTTNDQKTVIARVLQAFSHNAQKAAMTYSKGQTRCCFCAKALDTKESVFAGYGPTCADNFGLPWGDTE